MRTPIGLTTTCVCGTQGLDAMKAKTAAERKANERQRHKEAGRTAVTVHVRPEYAPEVRALEAKLQRRENRKRGPAP